MSAYLGSHFGNIAALRVLAAATRIQRKFRMALKKDNSPAKSDAPTSGKRPSRKMPLMRGFGVFLFLAASAAVFLDVTHSHAAGGFFSGKAIYLIPLQLAAVALIDFANAKLRQTELAALQADQNAFHERTADKTADLDKRISDHLYEVYQRTLDERDSYKKEIEDLREQEKRELFEQLEKLKEEKSELEARLISFKFGDREKDEDQKGGKIFAA